MTEAIPQDLFHWTPPKIEGDRDGVTYDRARDLSRLNNQARLVFDAMRYGDWRSLAEIAAITGAPEASISARLRDFRKPTMGGFTVQRRRLDGGLWQYRVMQ